MSRSEAHSDPANASRPRTGRGADSALDPTIGDLVTHLGEETKHLVEVQVRLAKMQVLDTAAASIYDGIRLGVAASIIGLGALCLLVALVLGLSVVFDSFWLGALASGLLLVATGALMVWRAMGTLAIERILPADLLAQVRHTLRRR